MITLENVTFRYKGQLAPAIDGISLSIGAGEFVGIVGPGSAGKSTFAYLLNGVAPHHYEGDFYGRVVVDGMDTAAVSLTDISRVVGSVFEDIDGQMVSSTVEDEMLFGLINFGYGQEEIEARMGRALTNVGIMDLRQRDIDSLSGGQKQKVVIAAMLAMSPKVLVLDEPTGELDPASADKVYALLREINKTTGATIIVVEKKAELLCAYADRVVALHEGKIAMDGPIRRIMGDVEALAKIGLEATAVSVLYNELKGLGLYDGDAPLTVDDAERMVREALGHVEASA